jgi:hypothetical protein
MDYMELYPRRQNSSRNRASNFSAALNKLTLLHISEEKYYVRFFGECVSFLLQK